MPKNYLNNLLHIVALAFIVVFASCSESDPIDEGGEVPSPSEPVEKPETVDYNEFKQFLADRIGTCDYCKELKVADDCIRLTCVSSKVTSIAKNKVPVLAVDDKYKWVVDGKATSISAGFPEIGYVTPKVEVATNGNLVVNGITFDVKAGDKLRCIINARKQIYFCFADETGILGNEEFGKYNPVLPVGDTELNILFIGNSFTMDATDHLPGMITAAGLKNVNMTRLYHGGYTLPEYAANYTTANICARRNSKAGDTWWDGNNVLNSSLRDALMARPWDIVVLQEHTGRREGWVWPGTLKPAVESLVGLIHGAHPTHRPTIIYLMSQTYSNGSSVLVNNFGDSRPAMYSTTTAVVKGLLSDTFIDIVIPSGTVLENLRTTKLNVNNGLQLTRDSYHMDLGISCYAAACAVYKTIITPCTGKKLEDNPYRYNVSSTASKQYCTPVTDDNAPIAQRAAEAALTNPFQVTDLSGL